MYQALLTRKYLTSKIMPLLAMVAVMLSVATVLVTWSVMGGFLRSLLDSGRVLVGDVAITWPATGFAHYEDLMELLEADDLVIATSPVIEQFAVVQLPDDRVEPVYVKGVDPESFDRVTGFISHLWWKPLDKPTRRDKEGLDWRLRPDNRDGLVQIFENGKTMTRQVPDGSDEPAALLGIELTDFNYRNSEGVYVPLSPARASPDGSINNLMTFMPRSGRVTLTFIPASQGGRLTDPVTRSIAIANEFQSGIYEADNQTMLVPLSWIQDLLRMDGGNKLAEGSDPLALVLDPETGELVPAPIVSTEPAPARVTTVLVRAHEGVSPDDIKGACQRIYREFAAKHPGQVPAPESIQIQTWEDLNATLVGAVKKETGLVLFIFGIVCFTTVFLVLAIFWAMVNEKTRDIGVLRALGASTNGVAVIWLSYGFALGLVGSVLGVIAATLIVTNINPIHEWLGSTFGLVVWDPRVYYFVEIPSEVVPVNAAVVFGAGILTCILGAAIPAFRSARMDPVKSLRFE